MGQSRNILVEVHAVDPKDLYRHEPLVESLFFSFSRTSWLARHLFPNALVWPGSSLTKKRKRKFHYYDAGFMLQSFSSRDREREWLHESVSRDKALKRILFPVISWVTTKSLPWWPSQRMKEKKTVAAIILVMYGVGRERKRKRIRDRASITSGQYKCFVSEMKAWGSSGIGM